MELLLQRSAAEDPMINVRSACCAGALVAVLCAAVAAQEHPTTSDSDPVIGIWQLDLAKSKYTPGPAPRREVRTYEYEHEGVKATIVTIDANGQEAMVEYVASYNDVVALVTGSEQVDAIKMRRINDTTAESTLSYQGRAVGTARRVIAPDGKSMTITFTRSAPTPVNNLAYYTKVDGGSR
jgi:hypothetical protein